MDVLSGAAAGFLAAVALALALPLPRTAKLALLVVANLAFLALHDRMAPGVFLAVSLAAFGLARLGARGISGGLFALLAAPIAALLFLPKTGLFGTNPAALALTGFAREFAKAPAAFVASSYFTMRALHFALDARREGKVPGTLLEMLAWNGFFPTLIAGPIERFGNFSQSLDRLGRPDFGDFTHGAWRIFVGVLKKVVLSELFFELSRPLLDFGSPAGAALGTGDAWLALYAFGLYFYFDFSGYSDLAIGAGRICGIRLAENFDNPYLRPNISEFWRTWHISLSTWIRDYVFLPLCGRSTGAWRPRAASVASMVLCGLWHGPTLGWAVWGVFHGAALALHQSWTAWLRKRFQWKQRLAKSRVAFVASTLVTFHFLAIAWIWTAYAGAGLGTSLRYLARLFAIA
ncbi:MAG: MBOAT family protein [Planctomycetes bacterium]|nr:MBOAT family protein [Planctomycetota bacterium]